MNKSLDDMIAATKPAGRGGRGGRGGPRGGRGDRGGRGGRGRGAARGGRGGGRRGSAPENITIMVENTGAGGRMRRDRGARFGARMEADTNPMGARVSAAAAPP